MKDIVFEKLEDRNQFSFKDEKGTEFCFEYCPSIKGLWSDIDSEDFDVQLLIHPFLNNESNVFALESNIKSNKETVGYIFPVAALDSDNFEAKRPADNNYFFVAYKVLLERLNEIPQTANSLGMCFEENVCVCVLNRRTIGRTNGLWNCIHSLRKFGYSYFVENNNYHKIQGYNISKYKELLPGTRMVINFSIPSMYSDPIIDEIMRTLPKADNLVHRFMLLYQVVEFLISKKVSKAIQEAIGVYQASISCSENDFLENISHIRKERGLIKDILEKCKIASSVYNKSFNNHCKHLFGLAKIVPSKKNDEENLFYSFRNSMVHSYRHLNSFSDELADTIFYYEQVVLTIVERYPYAGTN